MKDTEFTQTIKLNLILIGVLSLVSIFAVYREFYQPSTDTIIENAPNTSITRVKAPNAFFFSQIFLERDTTFVLIPFMFEDPQQDYPLWLRFKALEGEPLAWLMYHPQLMQLDWPAIKTPELTLYQKQANYADINEFLSDPPQNAQISADPRLSSQHPQLNALPINTTIDLSSTDYILTTFKQPTLNEDGFYYYEIILDATKAWVDEDDQLVWEIIAPGATPDNQLLLKEIHIDYRQNR